MSLLRVRVRLCKQDISTSVAEAMSYKLGKMIKDDVRLRKNDFILELLPFANWALNCFIKISQIQRD